ncbi:T9SS type A sorting domain-containing protein, partial [bacterium]|nr:T9SS type A sorting domain-containing protein [bacterium]
HGTITQLSRQELIRDRSLDNTVTDIGAFYFDQSGSSVLRQFRKEYPLEFILIHAYPNPFNAYTTITVNLLESVPLTLTVYNVTGQLIKTLYEGNLSAGMHRFPLNATMLSSGTYLVNATVPGKMNKVQKITMLK